MALIIYPLKITINVIHKYICIRKVENIFTFLIGSAIKAPPPSFKAVGNLQIKSP